MHPLNKKHLFKHAHEEKDAGKSGYMVMFEDKLNYYSIHYNARREEPSRFAVRQDGFCSVMDSIYKRQREMWTKRRPVRKIARIAFLTFFDDPRLTKEFHSLYYHWWTTNRWTHFCHEYVAFTL
ncbi:MAG: hypothetical protein QM688_11185 [Sphingomonas bacterium]